MRKNIHQKTILFGDDEQAALVPLKFTMEAKGYRVLEATTVQRVLELLRADVVDVLVMDIMMDPGEQLRDSLESHLAGAQALSLIKEISPLLQIVCLSVVSDHEILKMIRKSGAVYISKGETSLRKTVEILESKVTGIIINAGRRGKS